MNSISQYMNQFLDKVTTEEIYESLDQIPDDVGRVGLSKKCSQNGILYYDWNMKFTENIDVQRKGNEVRDEIHMLFCLNQDVKWAIEGKKQLVDLKKGEVCIYRYAHNTTSMCYTGQCLFQFKSIQISTDFFHKLLLQYFAKERIEQIGCIFLDQITKTKITPTMYHILEEIDDSGKYKEFQPLFLEGKMIELIAIVLHRIVYYKTTSPKSISAYFDKEKRYLKKIKELIDKHPEEVYPAQELAAKACMSVSKFNRLFRQMYGMSLHAMVIDKRLQYAAALLMEGKYSISEVASMSGYSNMSHFANAFRKKYKLLPKDYIK